MAKTILLADDSVTIQKVVELTFMDEDYAVVAVSDGAVALERLPEVAPDLVIADVHMPGADGYEVCRRTKERFPHIPVLLLVGTFEQFDEAQARAAGADGHLKKPFDSQELLSQVESLISASRAPDAAAPASGVPTAEIPLADVGAKAEAEDFSAAEPASAFGDLEPAPELDDVAAELDDTRPTVARPREDAGELLELVEEGAGGEVEPEPAGLGAPPLEAPEAVAPEAVAPEAVAAEALVFEEEAPAAVASEAATPEAFEEEVTEAATPEAVAFEEEVAEAVASEAGAREVVVPEVVAPTVAPEAEGEAPSEAAANGALSSADVERIARRVAEMVGEKMLREVAWEVVPDLAEVIIKERIRELESQVE